MVERGELLIFSEWCCSAAKRIAADVQHRFLPHGCGPLRRDFGHFGAAQPRSWTAHPQARGAFARLDDRTWGGLQHPGPGGVQVCLLHRRHIRPWVAGLRNIQAGYVDAATGHLIFHIPSHQLSGGCAPAHAGHTSGFAVVCDLPHVFPPTRGGPHCAGRVLFASARLTDLEQFAPCPQTLCVAAHSGHAEEGAAGRRRRHLVGGPGL